MLVEVLDREALVALAIEPLHLLGPVRGNRLPDACQAAVEKAGLAVFLVAARPPPKCPDIDPEQLGRLILISSADSQR